MANTYLVLPPEMGGTQFGPFTGLVQIGSDAGRCQIVLNPGLGVAPVHVTIAEQADGTYAVSPAQRGIGLFVARGGGMSVQPVPAAFVANPGDAIVLGQPGGPRFQIRRDESKRGIAGAVAPASARGRPQRSMGDAVGREMMRMGTAKLMTKNPVLRELHTTWYRYRTGALTNPRVLAGLIASGVALLLAGGAGCASLFAAMQAGLFGN